MSGTTTIQTDDPRVRGVLAANPGPLTGPGTTTWLVGTEAVAVIDPGPDLPGHVEAILAAAGGRISHILVTHAHLDHSQAAPRLSRACGAPVLGFGPAEAGRSPMMQRLAAEGSLHGGEGVDAGFRPDVTLADGDTVEGPDWSLIALHTPGHMGNHLSFVLPGNSSAAEDPRIFCGDLVMGWATTLISPPDGDLIDFMRSLERLAALRPSELLPAHGSRIAYAAARLGELADHRRTRTAQILAVLQSRPATAAELAQGLYDVPPSMLPAAARSVLSHLLALHELGAVVSDGPLSTARFTLSGGM